MKKKENPRALKVSIKELIARQEDKELERLIAKRRELTNMNEVQLNDYIYSQIDKWPVPINDRERKMLFTAMKASVAKMRVMSTDYDTRQQQLVRRKENKQKQAQIEAELNRPKLWEMKVDV